VWHVPHEAASALDEFASLLRRYAGRLDLVSPRDLDRLESRHFADSLKALVAVEEAPAGPAVDVGSGAGLPGIPLAIVSGRAWRLLEPRRRRAAFLEEVVRELLLDCEVLRLTAEQAARDPALAGSHLVATARAVADPPSSFELLLPLVAAGGRALVWLGKSSEIPQETQEVAPGVAMMEREGLKREKLE
jgi:16S rRNA (guanine(527)-N(7))-methyltransferase RsmG